MKRQMPEHDEDRIMAVFAVFCTATPVARLYCLKPCHEPLSISDILRQRSLKVHAEQHVIWVGLIGEVGRNDRCGIPEHQFEAFEKQAMYDGQVTRVLMDRPFAR